MATSGSLESTWAEQLLSVCRLADDVEADVDEQAREPFAQQHRVVGEHDAHGISDRSLRPRGLARHGSSRPAHRPGPRARPALGRRLGVDARHENRRGAVARTAGRPTVTASATTRYAACSTAGG